MLAVFRLESSHSVLLYFLSVIVTQCGEYDCLVEVCALWVFSTLYCAKNCPNQLLYRVSQKKFPPPEIF